jgi:lipoprotein-anchoring transpeptidase ErfK/SrfK
VSGDISGAARGVARRSWNQGAAAAAGIAGALLLAACSGGAAGHPRAAAPPAAKIVITSGDVTFMSAAQPPGHRSGAAAVTGPAVVRTGTLDTRPDLGVAVAAQHGRLASVVLRDAAGAVVPGSYAAGSQGWRTGWALAPGRSYQVTATAVNRLGRRTVVSAAFRTFRPARGFTAATTLTPGETVGVGMPIMVTFSRPITDRAAVERSLAISSSQPVTGAWYWMDSKDVWFRPQHYWPAHTQVRFTAHLAGVQGAPGVYGRGDLTADFRIGDALVARANTATHHMKVWWNGRLIGNWPISTGRPGMDTADGNYLSFAKASPVDMNSATIGIPPGSPGYYNELVYDAVQFTMSGTYIHSAPWSVGEQGYVNVSHGCVNVAPANAIWYYNHSLLGDPISVVGSPRPGVWGNGWTIYFLSWRQLLAGSATRQAVQAGPQGSQFVAAS